MLRLIAKLLPLIIHEVADLVKEKIKQKNQKKQNESS